MHKISKPLPFSDFEYLSGNETPFLSEKELLVGTMVHLFILFAPLAPCWALLFSS